jgi:hypothetical protein
MESSAVEPTIRTLISIQVTQVCRGRTVENSSASRNVKEAFAAMQRKRGRLLRSA